MDGGSLITPDGLPVINCRAPAFTGPDELNICIRNLLLARLAAREFPTGSQDKDKEERKDKQPIARMINRFTGNCGFRAFIREFLLQCHFMLCPSI